MSIFWSPVLKRFVLVSKSLQLWKKHIIDHPEKEELIKKYFRGLRKVEGGYNYDEVVYRLQKFLNEQQA